MGNEEHVTAHCNGCRRETNHQLIAKEREHTSDPMPHEMDDQATYDTWTESELLACCGCGEVKMRQTYADSAMAPGDEPGVAYFPPAVSRHPPLWVEQLDWAKRDLLEEVYGALHANSRRLAMMGARALIDTVAQDKVGDQGNFAKALEALVTQGYIGEKNREVLYAAFDAGSAAAHREHKANPEEVNQVIDITENLLQAAYLLEVAAANLRRKTPPRKRAS